MEDIYVYEDETVFIIKHCGLYYPFTCMDNKDELLRTVPRIFKGNNFYSPYTDKEVKETISKLDFIPINEWLILK
jgi:hypothetical protein